MYSQIAAQFADLWLAAQGWAASLNVTELLQNKWARATGMLALVWLTIWIIAYVYSGYMQDFEKGPVGLRPHVNKRQGESTIVFDKDVVPYQMDGVEAKCTFYFVYDNAHGKRRRVRVSKPQTFQLHIRPSPVPNAAKLVQFGFEIPPQIRDIPSHLVAFPTFEPGPPPPETVEPTPPTISEYTDKCDLVKKWTEDDDAPIVSISPTQLEFIAEGRASYIHARAKLLDDAHRKPGLLNGLRKTRLAKERPNVFGSYYVKLQFSQNPAFVLFKHPNRELKMTAWLTVLTSFFSLAMDLWPVAPPDRAVAAERPAAQSETPRLPRPFNR